MKHVQSHPILNAGGYTIVIKVGTSSLLRADQSSLNLSNLVRLCETVRDLCSEGHRVVIVSSGAVGVGCQRLGITVRPNALAQKQALAAVGQLHLMRYYEDFFNAMNLPCAQVLLTLDNLANRGQYLNARNTFTELFNYGTVPIVNENDTVAVEELRFGDNDTLSAQVATLVRADWLFLLTDVPSLFTANPATNPDAQPIHEVHDLASLQVDTSTRGTQWGTGGMATKLTAARLATSAGCRMAICLAAEPENVRKIINGARLGTIFHPVPNALRGRKRWILSVPVKGELWVDDGAVRAVKNRRKSLFSAGIRACSGSFSAQDAVRICDADGAEFARGLCNYSREEVEKIKGLSSTHFMEQLGYLGSEEIVHRDNLCLLTAHSPSDSEDATPSATPSTAPSPHHHLSEPPSTSTATTISGTVPALASILGNGFSEDGSLMSERSVGGVGPAGVSIAPNEELEEDIQQRLSVLKERARAAGDASTSSADDSQPSRGASDVLQKLELLKQRDRGPALGGPAQRALGAGLDDDVDWGAELAEAIRAENEEKEAYETRTASWRQ